MVLIRHLGGSLEEQVTGLLHDVSHMAFSHIVDWVFGDATIENLQDNNHVNFIMNSRIPEILNKHEVNLNGVCNHTECTLLDIPLPDVCVDRIDYALREFPEYTQVCIEDLVVYNQRVYFSNIKVARLFATHYLNKQMTHWGGFEAVNRYSLFGMLLKEAISKGMVAKDDFWQNDNYILDKIFTSKDKSLLQRLAVLEKKSLTGLPLSGEMVVKKFRYVDPEIYDNGNLFRLSEVDEGFRLLLEDARIENKKGVELVKLD